MTVVQQNQEQEDQAPSPGNEASSFDARRRRRALVMAWALGAMVVLFFVVTIVKLGGNVMDRPL